MRVVGRRWRRVRNFRRVEPTRAPTGGRATLILFDGSGGVSEPCLDAPLNTPLQGPHQRHYRFPAAALGRERRGQGLANLGDRGADGGGDRPDDHRPPRRPTPPRPRCRTVRAGRESVGRPCRAASGRPTCERRFGRCGAVAFGASWTSSVRGMCWVRGRLTAVSGFGKTPTPKRSTATCPLLSAAEPR